MKVDLMFWLILALSASISANILSFWYIRRVLGRFMFIGENLSDLVDVIANYQKHLSELFHLEQYYGDDDIKFMLSHTKSLIEILDEYNEVYKLTEEVEEEEESQEETETDAKKEISEENVFYAGARRRDN